MKNAKLFGDALAYVSHIQSRISDSEKLFQISDLPNLQWYEEVFPATTYYVSNIGEARYSYLSSNFKEFFGISAEEGTSMDMSTFVQKAFHPEDLSKVFQNFELFNEFIKSTPLDKIKDLTHIGSFRVLSASGEYRNVVDQSIVIECGADQSISQLFGAVSFTPPMMTNKTQSVVIDTSNGKEIKRFDLSQHQASPILTDRELQILRLLALGYKNKDVADKLFISKHTVETHRKNIMKKLAISNATDLVWKALELNVVDSKEDLGQG